MIDVMSIDEFVVKLSMFKVSFLLRRRMFRERASLTSAGMWEAVQNSG